MSTTRRKATEPRQGIPGAFTLNCALPNGRTVEIVRMNTPDTDSQDGPPGTSRVMIYGEGREIVEAMAFGNDCMKRDGKISLSAKPVSEVQNYIRFGFMAGEIPFTTGLIGLSQKSFAEKIGLSNRTLQRKIKSNKRLSPEESDRLFRIQKLTSAALALFEGNIAAMQQWLKTPLTALNGETPLAYSDTEPGSQFVLDLITRIEHGVFS